MIAENGSGLPDTSRPPTMCGVTVPTPLRAMATVTASMGASRPRSSRPHPELRQPHHGWMTHARSASATTQTNGRRTTRTRVAPQDAGHAPTRFASSATSPSNSRLTPSARSAAHPGRKLYLTSLYLTTATRAPRAASCSLCEYSVRGCFVSTCVGVSEREWEAVAR